VVVASVFTLLAADLRQEIPGSSGTGRRRLEGSWSRNEVQRGSSSKDISTAVAVHCDATRKVTSATAEEGRVNKYGGLLVDFVTNTSWHGPEIWGG
jgi:hypothetical protein